MLTTQDIKKLTEYLEQVFATKADLEKLDLKFTGLFLNLQASVDSIVKDNHTKVQELPVLNHRMKKVENWIDKASPKLGIKFGH